MRRKWIILLVGLLGCSTLSYLLFSKLSREKHVQLSHLCIQGPYFESVTITEFFSQIPCVDIKIGDKTATAKVDLGFCGDISLPRELIQELDDKSFIRRISYFGIRGRKYYSDVYKLPKIKMGEMTFFRGQGTRNQSRI